MPLTQISPRAPRARGGMESTEVLRALQAMCAAMAPGDVVPPHHEIMRRMDASERSVRWALDELHRRGVILRRPRAKTIIAGGNSGELDMPQTGVNNRTVIAIVEPDGGVFDQAMRVLMKQAKAANLTIHCRMMSADEMANFEVPSPEKGPLGYVVFRRHLLPLAERLHSEGHRVVFVGSTYMDTAVKVPHVSGDQEHGGYLVAKHLLDLGHRRLAIGFYGDFLQSRRWVGMQHALEEARADGIEVQCEILDPHTVAEWGGQHEQARAYFERADAPTAIAAWNDDIAINLLTLLQHIGLRVPTDVSIVGYDNLTQSATVHPALTTVDGELGNQIKAAVRLLTQPQPASNHQSIIVLPTLVRRESAI